MIAPSVRFFQSFARSDSAAGGRRRSDA